MDITDLEIQRKEQKIAFKQENGTLTLTAILIKALGLLLPQYPRFGASVDGESREIIYKKYVNIAVAIDTERGLLVPVISEADRKSLLEISQSLLQLSEKARKKKIKAADLEGGTFTVSNLGGIGTTGIFPLVNHPQVAILGVSKSTLRPVWRGQQFEPRLLMPLTLGFDHRIINGADAARFLVKLKRLLEVDFTIKSPGQ